MSDDCGIWWCTSHKREATHIDHSGKHICDPSLSGIMLPCFAVFVDSKTDRCKNCGSPEVPWFSRIVPMGYFCESCGHHWEESDGD